MKPKKVNSNIGDIVTNLIFISIPFIVCIITCLKEGIRINDVYIANSRWNDEVFYYKMIGAVAEYNQPLGYFGYNGSIANIGRFGPWSPVLFIFYIVYAKIFGWSMLSPIYCNIILMTIAMVIFAFLVRPTGRQICFFGLLYGFSTIITRYVFSNMSEISIYAVLIVYIGITVKMLRQEEKHNLCYELILNVLTCMLVLMRPYWLFLVVVPGYYWFDRSHKKIVIVFEVIWAVICTGLYFFISNNFCAAYYKSIINFDWLKMLFDSPIQGAYNMLYILVSSIWEILHNVGEGIIYGSPVGSIYALYISAIIYYVYIYKECTESEKIRKLCLGYWLCYFGVMLVAVIYLYDINVGSRHVTGFILIFIFVISLMETSNKRYAAFLGIFMWLLCIRATEQYTYQIPRYTDEKSVVLQKGKEELDEKGLIDLNSDNPWDNTIIWLYADETTVDFTYLYALPDGIGIELYFKENVLLSFDELKPKYIMTNIGEEIDLLCEETEKEKMAEYGNVHIWRLR